MNLCSNFAPVTGPAGPNLPARSGIQPWAMEPATTSAADVTLLIVSR